MVLFRFHQKDYLYLAIIFCLLSQKDPLGLQQKHCCLMAFTTMVLLSKSFQSYCCFIIEEQIIRNFQILHLMLELMIRSLRKMISFIMEQQIGNLQINWMYYFGKRVLVIIRILLPFLLPCPFHHSFGFVSPLNPSKIKVKVRNHLMQQILG